MPIFYGNPFCPLLPKRLPVHSVIGMPIKVGKNVSPSEEEVSEVHDEYLKALSELFDDHKSKLGLSDLVLELI